MAENDVPKKYFNFYVFQKWNVLQGAHPKLCQSTPCLVWTNIGVQIKPHLTQTEDQAETSLKWLLPQN